MSEEKKEKKRGLHITVRVPLTEEDLLKLGEEAAQMNNILSGLEVEKNKIESEKKAALDKIKAEIIEITSKIRLNLCSIKNKTADKVVYTEERFNLETKEAEYWYNDEIVKVRAMTEEEKQLKLDLDGDEYPEENETNGLIMPEWLVRGNKVNYQYYDDIQENCIIMDIKIEKDECTQDINEIKVKLDKISDYIDYSYLSSMGEDDEQQD